MNDCYVSRTFRCFLCGMEVHEHRGFQHQHGGSVPSIDWWPDGWHEIDGAHFICDRHVLSVDGKPYLWESARPKTASRELTLPRPSYEDALR